MRQTIITWLGRRLRGRYVLLLEEELARLRAENRALVNSLLGTAGFPPISPEDDARRGGPHSGAPPHLDADRPRKGIRGRKKRI
jgi:hypothetical protein